MMSDVVVLLEDRLSPEPSATLYRNPIGTIECSQPDQVEQALSRLDAALDNGLHAAGFISYDLGYAFEATLRPLMAQKRTAPLLWFGLFRAPECVSGQALDAALAKLPPPPPITDLAAGSDLDTHVENVRQVLAFIEAGDIYQANLTFQMRFRYSGDWLSLYAALRVLQPVAHGGLVAMDGMTLLSVSPELWIDGAAGVATMRPMKGTIARGDHSEADEAAKLALAADPKQQAENLMIVDLLRNDLSRIAQIGSVRVPRLFTLETYPSFHTLTSTITAELKPALKIREIVEAAFPCGSIVGVPKIRALQILAGLEQGSRGVYTGAIGAISPDRTMKFNVAIRTAVIADDGAGTYGVGGGIVADSDPVSEYEEALLKGRFLRELATDFGLIETFKWSAESGFVRLDLHLQRLAKSASELGFTFDRVGARDALAVREREVYRADANDMRIRLLLGRDGNLDITAGPLPPDSAAPLRVGMSEQRLDPADPFLRHKTTRRRLYEQAYAEAQAKSLDDMLFFNTRGELAEASRNTIFVEISGRLVTPPVESGLLAGILRQSLIEAGQAGEQILVLDDLRRAGAWFLGSSLRGLRRAVLVEAAAA